MATKSSTGLSPYNETLNAVTSIKLHSLSRQKDTLTQHFSATLSLAAAATSPLERLTILYEGLDGNPVPKEAGWLDIGDVKTLLEQANKGDVNFGQGVLVDWCEKLEKSITQGLKRFEYAYLFGSTLTEWLQTDGKTNDQGCPGCPDQSSEPNLSRSEKIEQKDAIENVIFSDPKPDIPRFHGFLENLFAEDQAVEEADKSQKKLKQELKNMRKKVKEFAASLLVVEIKPDDVKQVIEGLLAGEGLDDEKKLTYNEIKSSAVILKEISNVINILLRDLPNWQWPEDGVEMVFRRQINGKYRGYLDEDVVTAIFLQYVGVEWGVQFRGLLDRIFGSDSWKKPGLGLDARQVELRKHMYPRESDCGNLKEWREGNMKEYFMTLLPTSNQKCLQTQDLKQKMFYRILTEAKLSQTLAPETPFTVVYADFKMFGPSLPHDVLLEVLRFVGVESTWLGFFKTFLRVNTKFTPDESLRVRTRGVPISHSLSKFLIELLMFFLEFSVNQKTQGMQFSRVHDDFWFWDRDEKKCVMAWEIMKDFAEMTGLEFNKEKSGSVKIFAEGHPEEPDNGDAVEGVDPLPNNRVKWRFLELHSDAMFRINQEDIDEHIAEMKIQLAAPKSILGFINAYNRYMEFIIRNFAEPVQVFTKHHIRGIIFTLDRIHHELFPATNGDVLEHIKALLKERFPEASKGDILDAWILWPISHGGLGVTNNLINLHSLLRATQKADSILAESFVLGTTVDPMDLQSCIEIEKEKHNSAKTAWESRASWPKLEHLIEYELVPGTPNLQRPRFLTWEEYIVARETRFTCWFSAATKLCHPMTPDSPAKEVDFHWVKFEPFGNSWRNMPGYWKWVLAFYGQQLTEKFGSLNFVNSDLIPLGMVDSVKFSSVNWE